MTSNLPSARPRNSQFWYFAAVSEAVRQAPTWLDLGCGHQFVPTWLAGDAQPVGLPPPGCTVIGIDLDVSAIRAHANLHHRIIGSVERLPVKAASVDLVTANMVVEHVEDPASLFAEVNRVLRPGGSFLVHTPNSTGYTTRLTKLIPEGLRPALANVLQGRKAEDVYPTWYRANTVSVLQAMAEQGGLSVSEIRTIESSAQLYRVPVIGFLEERFLLFLRRERLAHWRPCIIAHFRKETASGRGAAG